VRRDAALLTVKRQAHRADVRDMRWAAAILCIAVVGCARAGEEVLSIEEARDRPPSEVVRVQGPLVINFGEAMICTELAESSPPMCEAGLWLQGPLRQLQEVELETDGDVQWAESVTLRGAVDGDGFFILEP
jgi:hypothetical protein